MPGCRKLDTTPETSVSRGRVDVSTYVRHRARAPRASNDNRRPTSRFWHWALIIGTAPAIALVAAASALL